MNAFWADIESRFLKLHKEQRSANGLVYATECDGSWTLGGPEDLQKKFLSIVRNIAVRLGWANDKDPFSAWCDLLKTRGVGYHKTTGSINRRRVELDTEQICSIEREHRDVSGGTIDLLFKVSGEYCIECDTAEQSAKASAAAKRTESFTGDSVVVKAATAKFLKQIPTLQSFNDEAATKVLRAATDLEEVGILPLPIALSVPVVKGAFSNLAQKGQDVLQIKKEMKRIKNFARSRKSSIREIETDHPEFLVWTFAKSLPDVDRNIFENPRQWAAGYINNTFLPKYYGCSYSTIKGWIKAYANEIKSA